MLRCSAQALPTMCYRLQGLRTLVLATRVLEEQMYQEWNHNYEHAASSLEDREARIAAVSEKIGEHIPACTAWLTSILPMLLCPMTSNPVLDCIFCCACKVAPWGHSQPRVPHAEASDAHCRLVLPCRAGSGAGGCDSH